MLVRAKVPLPPKCLSLSNEGGDMANQCFSRATLVAAIQESHYDGPNVEAD